MSTAIDSTDTAPADDQGAQTDVQQDQNASQSDTTNDVAQTETQAEAEPQGPPQLDPAQFTDTESGGDAPDTGDQIANTDPSLEQPPQPNFLNQVQQLGFQDLADEGQAQQRLLDYTQQQQLQMQQLQAQIASMQPMVQYGQQYLQQQQAPPAQPEPQTAEPAETNDTPYSKYFNPPPMSDKAIERWTERDETGQLKWKPDAPLDIKSQTEQHLMYKEDWKEKFWDNPFGTLEGGVKEMVLDVLRQEQQQQNAQWEEQQQQQYIDDASRQIMEQHSNWMYVNDARTGQPMRDVNGQLMLTHEGQGVFKYLDQLKYIPDVNQQFNMALQLYHHELLMEQQGQGQPQVGQPQAPPQDPNAIAAQRKMEHLQSAGAGNIAPRGGSIDNPDQNPPLRSQNPDLRVEDKLLDNMKRAGMA